MWVVHHGLVSNGSNYFQENSTMRPKLAYEEFWTTAICMNTESVLNDYPGFWVNVVSQLITRLGIIAREEVGYPTVPLEHQRRTVSTYSEL